MQTPESLELVARFHTLFGAPILSTPQIPNVDRAKLRISLLQEELDEFKQAIEDNNIVEVADALADMQYVLSGAILEFGLGDLFFKIFHEVQKSNMSKACATKEEAEQTIEYYKMQKQTDAYSVRQ